MRTSDYIIFVSIPETSASYLIHGYTGAVDKVSPEIVGYLLKRLTVIPDSNSEDVKIAASHLAGLNLADPQPATIEGLAERGYLTTKTPEEERAFVTKLSQRLHQRWLAHCGPGFLLIPTYDCNMRCPYCYASEPRDAHTRTGEGHAVMSFEAADAAFRVIDELRAAAAKIRPDKPAEAAPEATKADSTAEPADPSCTKEPNITFLGGEPLMESTLPVIEYAIPKARERGYTLNAITNGVELNLFEKDLGPDGISWIQVTLDGPPDVHDRTRIGPKYRQGTYERILSNMTLAMQKGTHVHVRVHGNAKTASRLYEVFEDLDRRGFLKEEQFSIYVETTHSWDRGLLKPTYPDIALVDLLDQARPAFRQPITKGRGLLPTYRVPGKLKAYLEHGLAGLIRTMEFCDANGSMYIFDLHGDIYPCWDVTGLKQHAIGRYGAEGHRLFDCRQQWIDRCPAVIPKCQGCKYVFFHFSGCRAIPLRTGQGLQDPACYEWEDVFLHESREFFRRRPNGIAPDAESNDAMSAVPVPSGIPEEAERLVPAC